MLRMSPSCGWRATGYGDAQPVPQLSVPQGAPVSTRMDTADLHREARRRAQPFTRPHRREQAVAYSRGAHRGEQKDHSTTPHQPRPLLTSSGRSSGMPWHTHSLTLVHTDLGNLPGGGVWAETWREAGVRWAEWQVWELADNAMRWHQLPPRPPNSRRSTRRNNALTVHPSCHSALTGGHLAIDCANDPL